MGVIMTQKVPQIRVCPFLTAAAIVQGKTDSRACLRNGCMLFNPRRKDIQTPDECAFMSIGRNLLDTRMILEHVRDAIKDIDDGI